MRPSVALNLNRNIIRETAERYHTSNPRVFGSVLHGTDTDTSDLDLLVDARPDTTLLDLGGLQQTLEDLLGISVDVRTPEDLPSRFRQAVVNEAKAV